ncbi:MAG: twin-arginine translocase TatA/TatE family subunit [Planctomycetaceae bacterium]
MGFLPGVGTTEMLIVGIIALLLFGRNLPNVAKNLGKSFAEFKKGMSGFQEEFRNVTRDAENSVRYTPPESKPATPEERPKVAASDASADDDFSAPKFDLE